MRTDPSKDNAPSAQEKALVERIVEESKTDEKFKDEMRALAAKANANAPTLSCTTGGKKFKGNGDYKDVNSLPPTRLPSGAAGSSAPQTCHTASRRWARATQITTTGRPQAGTARRAESSTGGGAAHTSSTGNSQGCGSSDPQFPQFKVNHMGKPSDELERISADLEAVAAVLARSAIGDPDYQLDGTHLLDELLALVDAAGQRATALLKQTDAEER